MTDAHTSTQFSSTPRPLSLTTSDADVVLIGAGIMTATYASMLAMLEPSWRIVVLEKSDAIADESSNPWNNAGTGHSGFCELNHMPDPSDGTKSMVLAEQFHLSRQWWSHLVDTGALDPHDFIHPAAHMDLVFGDRDVDYLRRRVETLRRSAHFSEMEFSTDHAEIAAWAPLTMEGRASTEVLAASRDVHGTDVDYGALTRALLRTVTDNDRVSAVRTGHEVTGLRRSGNAWTVSGRGPTGVFSIRARSVFVGAGGFALHLLQKAGIPEVRGYGVLPVGAAFFQCSTPSVVDRHSAKVYGQAAIGAPPMSVPHLDARVVEGRRHLLFGPYATFSTKLLKHGRLSDFFTTLRWSNLRVLTAAGLQNLDLVTFLISQLAASPAKKFEQLRHFYPQARRNEWRLIPAGQRAQIVRPDPDRVGALQMGTEVIVSEGGSMSGLLGASPGASTAVAIMCGLLRRTHPEEWEAGWHARLAQAIPDLDRQEWSDEAVTASYTRTDRALGLNTHSPR